MNFTSKPLSCFQITAGKFAGIIFFFKDVYAKKEKDTANNYEVSFSYNIVGGNYRDRGYDKSQDHLNKIINDTNKELFLEEIGKILNLLLSNNDLRIFVQWIT
jgi:hypothetical protein